MSVIKPDSTPSTGVRLDKWLWAARFFKTRSLAAEEIHKGRVSINGSTAKAAREVRVGDTIALRQGNMPKTVVVRGISGTRGPAAVAQLLYAETEHSIAKRENAAALRKSGAMGISTDGKPTKKQRRQIHQLHGSFE